MACRLSPGHFVEPCRKSGRIAYCADSADDSEPYVLSYVFGLVFGVHETPHEVIKGSLPEHNKFLQGPRLAPSMLNKQKFAFD